jgi:hypothetical protein
MNLVEYSWNRGSTVETSTLDGVEWSNSLISAWTLNVANHRPRLVKSHSDGCSLLPAYSIAVLVSAYGSTDSKASAWIPPRPYSRTDALELA